MGYISDIIGNGKIIAALSELDIECVRGYGSYPLFSLYTASSHGGCSHIENKTSIIMREVTLSSGKIWVSDFCDDTAPVFIRKCEVISRPFIYKIKLSPDAKIHFIQSSYAIISDGHDCICISLKGACSFEGRNIRISPGTSYIAFISATPYELPQIKSIQVEEIYEKAVTAAEDDGPDDIKSAIYRQSENGGVLRCAASPECVMHEQEKYLKLFLASGLYDRARRILDFIIGTYTKNGFMPYFATPDGTPTICAQNPSSFLPATASICALEYLRATGDAEYIKKHIKALSQITLSQCDEIVRSHMPFCGREKLFDTGALPMIATECGSLLSDLSLIESSHAMCELSDSFVGRARLIRLANECKAHLSDYGKYLNTKSRFMRAKKKNALACRCEYCAATSISRKEEICYLNPKRYYICLSCYDKAAPEDLPKIHDIKADAKTREELTDILFN